jgi:hypothetical protein
MRSLCYNLRAIFELNYKNLILNEAPGILSRQLRQVVAELPCDIHSLAYLGSHQAV